MEVVDLVLILVKIIVVPVILGIFLFFKPLLFIISVIPAKHLFAMNVIL